MSTHAAETPGAKTSKLTVVGAGSVGSSIAYASLIRGSARRIALYDINAKKVDAEVKDLAHGTQFTPTSVMEGGADIEVARDSNVIIITAGARQNPGQTRLDLAGVNAKILSDMVPKLLDVAPNALLVLVTNPCDVLTVVAQKVSGLPKSRVFSTGTILDTSRLRWGIAQHAKVAQRNVHAIMVGEHGDTEFPIWSSATIAQIPIRDWKDGNGNRLFTEELLAQISYDTVHAAYEIIEGKGATNYAIGLAGASLVEALLGDHKMIMPISSVLEDYRGISGVAMSVPSLVTREGIGEVYEFPMDAHEIGLLNKSADAIRATLNAIGF